MRSTAPMHRYLLCCALAGAFALAGACSCGHKSDNKAAQLNALDDAYKSGVFNKQEYEAKKAAIQAQSQAPSTPPPITAVAPAPPPAESGPLASASPLASEPAAAVPPASSGDFAPPPASIPQSQAFAAKPARPTPDVDAKAAKPDSKSGDPTKTCDDASYKGNAGGPQTRFYLVAVDRAKKAAVDSLALLDFEVRANDGDMIEAVKRRHKVSMLVGAGGEHEILHFMPAQRDGKKGTLITGETKKSAGGFLAQKNWSATVLAEIACQLGDQPDAQ